MRKSIVAIIITVMYAVSCPAQETIFRVFTPQQYHGGTQNWDIEQLPDGRVAFANNGGLLLFDGDRWDLYPISNYSTVRSLYYEPHTDHMFAGASGEFGYYSVDPKNYHFIYKSLVPLVDKRQTGFGEIWRIVPWRGKIVFQSKTHLFIYDGKQHISAIHSPDNRIETIANIGGRLIAGMRTGLAELRGSRLVPLPGGAFKPGADIVVRDIVGYGHTMIVATQQSGLLGYDGKCLKPMTDELEPQLRQNQLFSAQMGKGGVLALGTVRAGLIVKYMGGGSAIFLNADKGLNNNTVLSTMFDNRGNIWLALDNGIAYAMPNVPFGDIVSRSTSIGTGYASAVVGSTLYLGTNQGLFSTSMPFRQQPDARLQTPVAGVSGQIWNLCRADGSLLCCADKGLFEITPAGARHIAGIDGAWTVCPLSKHPGYALVADYMGMALLHKTAAGFVAVGRVKTSAEVSGNIIEDSDGSIWMSHWQRGIYRLQLADDMKSLHTMALYNKSNQLLIDQNNTICKVNGQIYISTVDGFYRYDRRTRRLKRDKPFSQIFNTYGAPLKLTETPQHDIWAQKQDFIAIAHRQHDGSYTVDSASYRALAKNQQFGMGNLTPLDGGHTLINSNEGFYLVRNNFRFDDADFPLFIRRITSTADGDTTVYRHSVILPHDHITLPHDLNSLRIEFVAPQYQAEGAVTYSCLLDGYDDKWSQTNSSSKEYTQLSKGTYTFRVRAFNRLSGKTQETSIKITIRPAWYESWWAYIVYLALAAWLIYQLVRYLKWRAERKLRRERRRNEYNMREQENKLQIERMKRKAQQAEMEKEQLQGELRHKSSELASSTMNLIHQNDILQKLDEDMQELSESVRREERKTAITKRISDIRADLQTHMNDDESWNKFEENFNLVYDDFMKRLTEQFTTLKTSDRKLCAYLKMGLSSKEMASLLNMSVRSVETARYRLRKKLNLEAGDNLTDFIQNFNRSAKKDEPNN